MSGVKRECSSDSSSPSSAQSTPKKQRTPKKADPDKPKQQRMEWTSEEDAIFLELVNKILKDNLYAEVKSDGRLERGSSAVKAHCNAVMNKLKRQA